MHKDEILEESLKCKTRIEFRKRFQKAYYSARKLGILEEVCSHMIIKSYSTPQLILKQIMEELLREKCLYNNRKFIYPYEIDILFMDIKLAFEYDGERWHRDDFIDKYKMCEEKNILLITIIENSRKYEEDVKNQLILNLDIINKQTNKSIKPDEILLFEVDYLNIVQNLQDIENICNKYTDYYTFKKNEKYIYNILVRNKLISKLTSHMKRRRINYKDEKYSIENIKILIGNHDGNISSFSDKYAGIYIHIKRNGLDYLLDEIRELKKWNIESILDEIKKYEYLSDFMKNSKGCYQAIKRLKLDHLLGMLERKKKSYTIEQCVEVINRYKKMKDFIKNEKNKVYSYCYTHNLEYLYSHLEQRKKWTEEELSEYINRFSSIKELRENFPKIYDAARKKNYKHLLINLKRYKND